MKKVLVLCFVTLVSLCSFAQKGQEEKEHLEFKGISMGLPYEQFAQKLKAAGFVFKKSIDGDSYDKLILFKGTFAGVKDCEIVVKTPGNKKYVVAVFVLFPRRSSTPERFKELKEAFVKKYGDEEIPDVEACFWRLDNGSISIRNTNGLIVSYIDIKNSERFEEDKEQRINDDI